MTISSYTSVKDNKGSESTLDGFLNQVKFGKYETEVSNYRRLLALGDDASLATAKEIKRSLPCVTLSGLFTERNSASLVSHSGFITIDLDNLVQDGYDKAVLKTDISRDPFVYAVGDSISGNGLFVVIPIEGGRHLDAFLALEKYFQETYALEVDKACKDVTRLRIVSFDPELEINIRAKVFKAYLKEKQTKVKPSYKPQFCSRDTVEKVIEAYIQTMPDFTGDYHTWCSIGFALASHLGESGRHYFERLSAYSSSSKQKNANGQYTNCLKAEGRRAGSRVGIGTLMHKAKQAGVHVRSKEDDFIANMFQASMLKTKDRELSKANTLVQAAGQNITAVQVEEIVAQIQDTDEIVMVGDDQHENLQVWIRGKNIWKDAISHTYHIGKEELTDEHVNNIIQEGMRLWKKQAADEFKVTPESIVREIYNTDTRSVHVINEFAEKHKHERVKGTPIKDLAASLIHVDKDSEFIEKYLRKWLIGFWAIHYGERCPLVLILVSGKQGIGKTHFLENIMPTAFSQYQLTCDLAKKKLDKDMAIEMCKQHLIIFDEMGTKGKIHDEDLKYYATSVGCTERAPYARNAVRRKRSAALCGTTNSREVLSDPTGNRRIIPLELEKINHALYNTVDKEALFIEALQAYLSGESFAIVAGDEADFEKKTEQFKIASSEEDLIDMYFTVPTKPEDTTHIITAAGLVATFGKQQGKRLTPNTLGKMLKKAGYTQTRQGWLLQITGQKMSLELAMALDNETHTLALKKIQGGHTYKETIAGKLGEPTESLQLPY